MSGRSLHSVGKNSNWLSTRSYFIQVHGWIEGMSWCFCRLSRLKHSHGKMCVCVYIWTCLETSSSMTIYIYKYVYFSSMWSGWQFSSSWCVKDWLHIPTQLGVIRNEWPDHKQGSQPFHTCPIFNWTVFNAPYRSFLLVDWERDSHTGLW
jgi:hypothetical protein